MSITLVIVIITSIISYQAIQRPYLKQLWAHHPYSVAHRNEWYRLVSSGFVHSGWMHLLINMFVLYTFGERIEYYFSMMFSPWLGRTLYLLVYLLTIVIANLPSQFAHQNDPGYFSLGASGGVSGIVFIFILFHPWEKLYLYFFFPIYAILGGVIYLIYSQWASKNGNDHIDHSAHFYGALSGIGLTLLLKPSLVHVFIERFINGLPF